MSPSNMYQTKPKIPIFPTAELYHHADKIFQWIMWRMPRCIFGTVSLEHVSSICKICSLDQNQFQKSTKTTEKNKGLHKKKILN